jgi:hypothetical protein
LINIEKQSSLGQKILLKCFKIFASADAAISRYLVQHGLLDRWFKTSAKTGAEIQGPVS